MQSVRLNMTPTGVLPHIYCSQYDIGRQFALVIYDEGGAYKIPEGATATIHGIKPDGKVFTYGSGDSDPKVSIDTESSTITVTTTEQMTAVGGLTTCELVIYKGSAGTEEATGQKEEALGSLNFIIVVEAGVFPDDDKTSKSDLATYQQMIENAKTMTTWLNQLIAMNKAYSFHGEKKTLLVSNWVGDSAPFSYDLGAEYANRVTIIVPSQDATDLQTGEWAQAQIFGDTGGVMYARKNKPKTDIPVLMVWTETYTEVTQNE